MPYSSIEEIPDSVKNALSGVAGAAKIWMEAFNTAYEGTCGGDDACASRIAWSAVKDAGYVQDESGVWKTTSTVENKKTEYVAYYCNDSVAYDEKNPRAILNTLERFKTIQRIGEGSKDVYFGLKNFLGSVASWNGVPLVYGKVHPDPYQLREDPVKAVKAVGGRIVGFLTDAVIPDSGEPRLEASTPFMDASTERLWKEGKLSLSSAFLCNDEPMSERPGKYALKGMVIPNHVLVFERSPRDQPVDGGAVFLNKRDSMPDDEVSAKLSFLQKQLDQLKAVNAEKDELIANKENALKEFAQKQKDSEWASVAERLPRGFIHGTKAIESRESFEANPAMFMCKVLDVLKESHETDMIKAGQEYMQKQTASTPKAKDYCTGIYVDGKLLTQEE